MKRPVGSPPRAEAAGAAMPPARVCPAHERKKRQLFQARLDEHDRCPDAQHVAARIVSLMLALSLVRSPSRHFDPFVSLFLALLLYRTPILQPPDPPATRVPKARLLPRVPSLSRGFAKYKMKSHSGYKKRIKITGRGKYRHVKCFGHHKNERLGGAKSLAQRGFVPLHKSATKRIRKCLPTGLSR